MHDMWVLVLSSQDFTENSVAFVTFEEAISIFKMEKTTFGRPKYHFQQSPIAGPVPTYKDTT